MFYLLRSSAIVCDCLRSYGNQSSAICDRNVSHNIFNSDPRFNASKPQSPNVRTFVYNMADVEHGNVTNEEFMEEVVRYECVYNRNSKDFKDKNKKNNSWQKSPKFLSLHKYFSKPMFPSVLRLTLSSL